MKTTAIALLVAAVTCLGLCSAFHVGVAMAQPAGSASAADAPGATPADKLHDPTQDPVAAFDDLKAAKKTGWTVLAFACVLMLAKLAGRAKSYPWLSWLGSGRTPIVVAAVSTAAAGCYNAALSGGSYTAVGAALIVGLATYLDPKPAAAS